MLKEDSFYSLNFIEQISSVNDPYHRILMIFIYNLIKNKHKKERKKQIQMIATVNLLTGALRFFIQKLILYICPFVVFKF